MPRSRKPNISSMEAHHTSNPWTYLEVKRSTEMVTETINPVTKSVSYLTNGKTYKRQTWYTDIAQRSKSPTSAMTAKVKGKVARSCDASDKRWPVSEEGKGTETPTLVAKLPTSRATTRTSFKVRGQRSRSRGQLMLRQEVRYIFRMERPTNLKLGTQMEYDDPYYQQTP